MYKEKKKHLNKKFFVTIPTEHGSIMDYFNNKEVEELLIMINYCDILTLIKYIIIL